MCLVEETEGILEKYNKGSDEVLTAYEPFGDKNLSVNPAKVEALSELMFN
jgi:hypothetical protein